MSRLFPVIALVLAIVLFFVYIKPTYTGAIADEQAQITSFDKALAAAQTFTEKENQLIAARNAIPADQLNRLQEFLPDSVDNVQLILDLDSLATRSGLALSDFSIQDDSGATASQSTAGTPGTQTPGSVTSSLDISVTAKGTYTAFRTFLNAAEQSLRPLDVMSVDIKTSGSAGIETYIITFRIYWLNAPST